MHHRGSFTGGERPPTHHPWTSAGGERLPTPHRESFLGGERFPGREGPSPSVLDYCGMMIGWQLLNTIDVSIRKCDATVCRSL